MSERCPTCGRPVPSVFEHVDADCENWSDDDPTHQVTWRVEGRLCSFRGDRADVSMMRDFMLNVSPLKREDISEVTEIKE